MIRKITLLSLAFLLIHFASFAQKACGFDAIHQRLMATDPAYAQAQAQFRASWNAYLDAYDHMPQGLKQTLANGTDTVYEIPVVVHIMHTGGAPGTLYNPSDAMVQAYINYTNAAWEANYGSYPTNATGGRTIPIKFVLAKRDTLCNAATGIIRYNASSVGNYASGGVRPFGSTVVGSEDEVNIKNFGRWNPSLYYNIWIVNKIEGADGYGTGTFTAGYAYLASGTSATLDGTVILASRVYTGVGATGGGPGDITLPHELGHAFNLKHVFDATGGTGSCPSPNNCSTTGDEICDTQPIASSNFTCPAPPATTCNGAVYDLTTPHNFMDYSNCQDRFTQQQKMRMMYALKNQISRSPFITSLGATAPPSTTLPTACNIVSNNPSNNFAVGPRNIIISENTTSPIPDTLMHVTSGGYSNTLGDVLVDNTCRHMVTLKAGRSYNLLVNVGSGYNNSKAKVFIDYNNNGIFTTGTGERVMSSGSGSGGGYKSAQFIVPTTGVVYCVPIRMRVIVDGVGGGGNVDSCGNLDNGQAEDYTVMILGNGSSAAGSVVINDPPLGGKTSCNGTQLTFWEKPGTGITVTAIRWLVNNVVVPGQTTDTFKANSPVIPNNATSYVKARILFTTPCGTDSVESNVDTIIRTVTVAPTVNIAVKSGTNPGGCVDDTVYYRVSASSNPGGSPTYQWQQKPPAGVFTNILGATDTVLKVFGYPAGTQIQVIMTSSAGAPCAIPSTATSPQTAATTLSYSQRPPTVSIALTTGTNPGCAGQTYTFTATPTTGGKTPTYVWKVNGTVQTGVTGATFSKVLANNDQVTCTLTSSSACANPLTANSNTITIGHTLITADVSIAELTASPSCNGKPAVFQATTVNSGTGPLYQWILNGANVGTPGSGTFTVPVVKNDVIKCIFIATDPCVINATDTSNILTVDTQPSDTPSVTIKITKGKNPGCIDSLIEFTANPVRTGIDPEVAWMINGFVVSASTTAPYTFSSTSLLTGDIVQARIRATDGNCYLPDTIYGTPDTMKRSITLDPPIIHLIGNMIVVDRTGKFIWFGPGGQLTGSGGTYHPTAIGPYYAIADNNGCWSKPSNILTITLLDVSTLDLTGLKVYPNPSNGYLTLDWGGKLVTINVEMYNQVGQLVMHDDMKNGTLKNINMTKLANGTYFVVVKDDKGNSGTIKVALSR
jgi:hypothetical protein